MSFRTHILLSVSNLRSGDSTARIWTIADGNGRSGAQNVLVLKHVKGRTNEKSKDVTTLDWNVSLCFRFFLGDNCLSSVNSLEYVLSVLVLKKLFLMNLNRIKMYLIMCHCQEN